MINCTPILCALFLWCGTGFLSSAISNDDYLSQVFSGKAPKAKALWITGDLKQKIVQAIGDSELKIREKYWQDGDDLIFILERIGKVKPITAAWHIRKDKIIQTKVLVYRESRGGEVARSFFTQLFEGIGLKGQSELSSHIDGISGATLSVNSMKKMARQALIMAQHLNAT